LSGHGMEERRARPTEAEVVRWLKKGLVQHGRPVVRCGRSWWMRMRATCGHRSSGSLSRPGRCGSVDRWIGDWRPDLVCVVEGEGAERLAGLEVKSTSDHEKGLIQANRYREGVHEAYLCIPAVGSQAPGWVRRGAMENGVGLLRASAGALVLDVEPSRPRPDPRLAQITRRYVLQVSWNTRKRSVPLTAA
jgi:hypothetical protein